MLEEVYWWDKENWIKRNTDRSINCIINRIFSFEYLDKYEIETNLEDLVKYNIIAKVSFKQGQKVCKVQYLFDKGGNIISEGISQGKLSLKADTKKKELKKLYYRVNSYKESCQIKIDLDVDGKNVEVILISHSNLKKKHVGCVELPSQQSHFEMNNIHSSLTTITGRNKQKPKFLPENPFVSDVDENEEHNNITKLTDLVVLTTEHAFRKSLSISKILEKIKDIPIELQPWVFGKFLADIHWRPDVENTVFIPSSSSKQFNIDYKLLVDLDQMNAQIDIEPSGKMY
jgi:hypothetical protein